MVPCPRLTASLPWPILPRMVGQRDGPADDGDPAHSVLAVAPNMVVGMKQRGQTRPLAK